MEFLTITQSDVILIQFCYFQPLQRVITIHSEFLIQLNMIATHYSFFNPPGLATYFQNISLNSYRLRPFFMLGKSFQFIVGAAFLTDNNTAPGFYQLCPAMTITISGFSLPSNSFFLVGYCAPRFVCKHQAECAGLQWVLIRW